jgi:hypothetical protein
VFSFTIPLAEGGPILDKNLSEMHKPHHDESDHPAH